MGRKGIENVFVLYLKEVGLVWGRWCIFILLGFFKVGYWFGKFR